ncbi:MAG: hypothetical protein IPN76_30335 [Saprospiraceae bacterium]|nr:hypothetical protein [Saprospiraceae bacterium]
MVGADLAVGIASEQYANVVGLLDLVGSDGLAFPSLGELVENQPIRKEQEKNGRPN